MSDKNNPNPEILEEELPEEELLLEEEETTEEQGEETELEAMAKLLKESEQRYLRVAAEYDNYRKRTIKEKDGIYPQAQADTVGKFLVILDSFERALEYEPCTPEFAKGIELIDQNFKEVLAGLCVERIGEIGEAFDPNLHNAVLHTEDPSLGKNVISQVLEQGYKIGERVIRYAIVQTAN